MKAQRSWKRKEYTCSSYRWSTAKATHWRHSLSKIPTRKQKRPNGEYLLRSPKLSTICIAKTWYIEIWNLRTFSLTNSTMWNLVTLDLPLAISKIRGKQFKIPGKGIRNRGWPNQRILQKVMSQESMRIPFNLEFRHFQKLKIQKISYLKCQRCQNYAVNIQILTIYTAHQNI